MGEARGWGLGLGFRGVSILYRVGVEGVGGIFRWRSSSGEVVARITDHQDRNFANFSKQEILSLFHSGGGRLYFVV